MSVFDLKPLSDETIQELKLQDSDLWEIKIDEKIFGPFETLQLRHYAKENHEQMLRALVSPLSVESWRPFHEVKNFIAETNYEGPFWVLINGQKSAALTFEEVAKRIELGTITRLMEVSSDDGRHWHRISSHPDFEAHFTSAATLPETPDEETFYGESERILEIIEQKKPGMDEKSQIAYMAHFSLLKSEKAKYVPQETLKIPKENIVANKSVPPVKKVANWGFAALALAMYFVFVPNEKKQEVSQAEEGPQNIMSAQPKRSQSKKDNWQRTPAQSSRDDYYRSEVTQTPPVDEYPTVIETHHEDQAYPDPDREAQQIAEINEQESRSEEYSLVQQQNREIAQENESLDAVMNNEAQDRPDPAVDQPVVEEVSDF